MSKLFSGSVETPPLEMITAPGASPPTSSRDGPTVMFLSVSSQVPVTIPGHTTQSQDRIWEFGWI